ncbi:reverse transcriptase domain-containing protein [Tanacetum coccineum]
MGVNLDKRYNARGSGVYTFRVQGGIYHKIDQLVPRDGEPRYLQLYFYDVESDFEHKLKWPNLDREIITILSRVLALNPYVRTFRSLGNLGPLNKYRVELTASVKVDQRLYNRPTTFKAGWHSRIAREGVEIRELDDAHDDVAEDEEGSKPINRGLIQAIPTSLPPQPIGEHKINEHKQLQIFYQGLDLRTRKKADFIGPIPRMTPAARIKAIDKLSKHSLSWYKEEEYKENNFDKVLKHINDFKHNISVLNKEVRMVQHQYKTPNDERDSLLEETVSFFIKEAHWRQKKSESFVWRIKRNYDRTFKNQASAIKRIEKNLNRIDESIHGRGVGTLPSFTKTNPRGLAHAITTRSDLKPTRMCIELANKTTQFPKGIAENVMVKIDKFVLPVDFVILDMEEDRRIPIILGRPFLATSHAMIGVFNKKISFEVGDEIITFDLEKSMRFPPFDEDICHSADIIDLSIVDSIKEILPQNHDNSIEPILNHLPEDCNNPDLFAANSIDKEIPTLKFKELPSHLEYAFLDNNHEFPSLRYYLTRKKGYFQITLAPKDQENTTFTCPYGTFAYRRMPFGLCNAHATFHRCMTAIFHDMCKDFMKVFMDDFSVFGNYFKTCLNNLSKMLARCEETNLVLNWEKCHFMIKEGIVLGHKISQAGIEVDKDKVDVIELTIEIKDKKGTENLVADHLSRLENPDLEELNKDTIQDNFPDEHLMVIKLKNTETDLWYADYANFLVSKIVPQHLTYYLRKKKFLNDVRKYIWDDPYLFKSCPDGIIRRCVFGRELHEILKHYHKGPTGGHYGADITARKIFESGFYWPTIFKDAAKYVKGCDACQRAGNISSRNQMPLTNILVTVDYVSKWVEAEALPTNDARVVVKFLKKLFSRFGVPKALISDRGTHFYNSLLEKTLKKYGVTHRLATPYHPQTSGQTENTNRAIKRILERTIKGNKKERADKVDDALWAFRTAYKTPISSTPFRIVYVKACYLSIELEHKAYWALKNINLDLDAARKHRFLQLNQVDEFQTDVYEHSRAYKERTKRWHDSKIIDKEFQEGEEGIKSLWKDGDNLKISAKFQILKQCSGSFLS